MDRGKGLVNDSQGKGYVGIEEKERGESNDYKVIRSGHCKSTF